MPQNTNLNVTPYYDDFDKNDNFYRVLFRPGFPIQARELTTAQSILQNQVESMGQHFFKEGSMVIPGQVGYDLNVGAILLQESFLGSTVETYREQITGTIIEGLTTGVKAKVLYSISASESEKDYLTLYVKYIDSGDTTSTTTQKTFKENEQLICDAEITFGSTLIEVGTPFAQLLPVDATTTASSAYINEGVYFIRGHFVNVPSSYLILEQYSNNPSYRVGLEIFESIVTPEDDETLNDNAAGTSNYSAPGAHRFKIKTSFVKRLIGDEADKDFIELLRINKSRVESFVNRTEYSELERSLARRTYEESGDYVIDSFDVKVREHLDDGFNNGVNAPGTKSQQGNTAAEDLASIEVAPGKAYIRGYRTEFIAPQYVDVEKPRDYKTVNNGIFNFNLGNFLKVWQVYGWPEITGDGISDAYQTLRLYDDWSPTVTSTPKVGANQIGRCRTVQLRRSSSANALNSNFGANSIPAGGVYDLYFFDVQMWTVINIANPVTPFTVGQLIRGRTFGATGYIVNTGNNTHYAYLEQVSGVFVNNEVLEIDGIARGSLTSAWSYQLGDTKSMFGYNNNNVVKFGCNVVLNEATLIEGNTVDVDVSDDITGFKTRFEKDLRPGDVLAAGVADFVGTNTVRVRRINQTAINYTAVNKHTGVSATIFDFANQVALLDSTLAVGTVADVVSTSVTRLRPFIFQKDYQNGELSFDLPEVAMKSISDESFFVYRNFINKTVSSGSITFTLPDTESFASLSSENYILTVVASTNATYPVGTNMDIDALADSGVLTVTFGAQNQSITITGLPNITTVSLTALVSKNTPSRKIKTAGLLKSLKVIKTLTDKDVQLTGLTYSTLPGTRVEDLEISLGLNDVYNIHAIYESLDENDASPPYVVLTESVFFANNTIVIGKTSGARARVISFLNTNLKLYYVILNEINFIPGEILQGFNATGDAITAIVDDGENTVFAGSKLVTDRYRLEPGQRTNYYDVSKLTRLPSSIAPTRRLLVIFDYFAHESSGDYFSAESYTGIPYKAIPTYKIDGSINFLRDQLDFRPGVKELASGSGTISAPYFVNCSTFDFNSRVYNTTGGAGASTIFDIMQVDSSFRSDYSWYLPRVDKLYLTHDAQLKVVKGVSGKYLIPPQKIENAMLLATIEYKPFMFDPERDCLITQEIIRRYTMKDIGDLETRLTHVEYYTSLSLLESQTDNTKVYDENGFDRLKNGYVVDDFTDHTLGAVFHPDYKCSLDFKEGQLRPQHYTTNVALVTNLSASSNVVLTRGNIAMLPYTEVELIKQPYASRTENINPFNVFTFIGRVDLTPASDDWLDTERMPARVENVEGDFSAVARDMQVDQNGFAPIQWGSWQTTWTGESIESSSQHTSQSGTYGIGRQLGRAGHGQRQQGLFYLHERTTFRVVNNQARQGVRSRIVPKIERKSLGDTVLSRSNIPWIRSRNIGFSVERVKPRTRFYPYFDGVSISNYVTPKVIELIKNSSTDARTNETPFVVGETVIGQTSGCRLKVVAPNDGYTTNPYGKGEETLPETYSSQTPYLNHDIDSISKTVSPDHFGNMQVSEILVGQSSGARAVIADRRLLSDNVGTLKGTFFIPSPKNDANPRWATGIRLFRFTTSEVNNTTEATSSAQTNYSASGTLQVVQENILAIRNAEIVQDTVSEERVVQSTRVEERQIGWYDPLAQSFITEEKGGVFLTSVDIYFQSKDKNIPVSMQIRTMENGYPTKTILPFSDVTITPNDVDISSTAAIPTRFTFRSPVYIKASTEYCFVLLSDSNEYKVWISRMGDIEVSGTRTISEQPYAGVLFKSQNASTWTADQYEDLKFIINRAKFTSLTGTLALNNSPQGLGNGGLKIMQSNPIATRKPQLVFTLDSGANYTFGQGANLLQETTGASATVVSIDTTTSPDTLTVTDVSGNWLPGTSTTFRVRSSKSIANITMSSVVGTFSVGNVVTGGTSTTVGIVTAVSGTSLTLNYITGAFTATEQISNTGGATATVSAVTYSGDSKGVYLSLAPSYSSDEKEILILHNNHCMHQRTNHVSIEGVLSEVSPTYLTNSLTATATSISVNTAVDFHTIVNGQAISNANPGYLKIGDEIILYSAISGDGATITVATNGRGAMETDAATHSVDDVVQCYTLDGIPLTNINKVHEGIQCPWMDTYMLSVDAVANNGIRAGGESVIASQNVQFETLTPTVNIMKLPDTDITARVNTTSATSVGNGGGEGGSLGIDQDSFVNDGTYEPVTLNDLNFFSDPRMICSEINEEAKLGGAKSFTMLLDMSTENDKLSPVVDMDRCSLICTTNRINEWPGGPEPYGQAGKIDVSQDVSTLPTGDQNDAVYITRLARLIKNSKTIRIDFQMSRPPEASVRVYYKAFDNGTNDDIDSIGWTLVGLPKQYDASPSEEILWKDYYYEVTGLNFNAFQIKIVMRSSNQAKVPLIADLRAIALAT